MGNVPLDLLANGLGDKVVQYVKDEIDYEAVIQSRAVRALHEISNVLRDSEKSDFDMVDEIVSIFIRYNLDCGECHDFG